VQPRGHHPVVLATNIHVHAADTYNVYTSMSCLYI
jgi:hypothetical protein